MNPVDQGPDARALGPQIIASQLPMDDFINLGVDQADTSGSPPTARQEGCDAAVSFEFHPPSTYGRAVHPKDARGLSQRQANVGRRIHECKGNDICLAARFIPGCVISIGAFHSMANLPNLASTLSHITVSIPWALLHINGQCCEFSVQQKWRFPWKSVLHNNGQRDTQIVPWFGSTTRKPMSLSQTHADAEKDAQPPLRRRGQNSPVTPTRQKEGPG
jgi:hypothetical protein